MRVFKTKEINQWAYKQLISDEKLAKAITELSQGLNDGDLGSGLYKKRIATQGKGKRGGYRTIIAYKDGDKSFFLHGYAKNEKANISRQEKKGFKELASVYFEYTDSELDKLVEWGTLIEVHYDSETK